MKNQNVSHAEIIATLDTSDVDVFNQMVAAAEFTAGMSEFKGTVLNALAIYEEYLSAEQRMALYDAARNKRRNRYTAIKDKRAKVAAACKLLKGLK